MGAWTPLERERKRLTAPIRVDAPERVPLVEDTCGTGHSTQIIGEEGALIFAVVLAESQ